MAIKRNSEMERQKVIQSMEKMKKVPGPKAVCCFNSCVGHLARKTGALSQNKTLVAVVVVCVFYFMILYSRCSEIERKTTN